MAGLLTNTFSIIGKSIQNRPGYIMAPMQVDIVRNISKHWNPKFKKERRAKVIKVQLPDDRNDDEITPEEKRSMLKKHGIYPARPWIETSMTIGCTAGIFEAYVPPEGDGKFSTISTSGIKQSALTIGKKTTSMYAIRKINNYLDDFSAKTFPEEAKDIYIKAHIALAGRNFHMLRNYVTEKAYVEMKHNITNKQIRWTFIESLEPARIVRARNTSISGKDNPYAQLTVRFHTKQTLAIYDRFGRLMHGSEIIAKDVLEYIVFERHLTNEYGTWRIHGKIIPSWQPPREPHIVTGHKPAEPVVTKEPQQNSEVSQLETSAVATSVSNTQEPPVARV